MKAFGTSLDSCCNMTLHNAWTEQTLPRQSFYSTV